MRKKGHNLATLSLNAERLYTPQEPIANKGQTSAMKRDLQRICRLILLPLAILWVLTACLPTSEYPVLVNGAPVMDPALAGAWEGIMDDDSDPVILYFIKADQDREDTYPGGLDLIMINEPNNEQGPEDWAALYALSARIGDNKFLSIEYRSDNGEEITGTERGFHLFIYEITKEDQLIVRGVDEDFLSDLVENQKVTGTISENKWFSEVRITAPSLELVVFLQSVDMESLFTRTLGPFTRHNP